MGSGAVQVWPEALIRVCQFHIVQAIRRWVDERAREGMKDRVYANQKRKKKKSRAFSLPTKATAEVIVAFRYAQRCRDTADKPWAGYQLTFEGEIGRICTQWSKEEYADIIIDYFRDNWWSNEWRGEFLLLDLKFY